MSDISMWMHILHGVNDCLIILLQLSNTTLYKYKYNIHVNDFA